MKTWAVLAAKHATLTSGIGFSVIPGLGTASLDGFALGALLVAAYFTVQNSRRQDVRCPRLPVRLGRGQVNRLRASRAPAARFWSTPDRRTGAQPRHGSLVRAPLNPAPARPSFLAAPAELPERDELLAQSFLAEAAVLPERDEPSFLAAPAELPERDEPSFLAAPTERDEMSRPYSRPDEEPTSSRPLGSDRPAESILPARSSWLPQQAGRSEESRPYSMQASAAWPSATRPEIVPGLTGPTAIRRTSRFRRRIDTMLVEMLGDDSDEIRPPRHAEPDEGFWGPGERADAPTPGYRSKHRLTDPAKEPKQPDGQRNVPRHAAPPASFSARLTGRAAAHAAW